MGECLYDDEIKIDIDELPAGLQEIINRLEKYNSCDDWLHYACTSEELEISVKYCYAHNTISAKQFDLLNKKYCGYA